MANHHRLDPGADPPLPDLAVAGIPLPHRTVVVGGDDVFTIDKTVFSREIAPLAGFFYPSVLGEA
ncbi:MAG: hypothetical protein ACRDPL_15880, partial [Propionibacteriaceae bacterium]